MRTKATQMEARWMEATGRADANNPLRALLGPRTQVETLALRASLAQRRLRLTTDHAASSYGIPVAVDETGKAYGPGDILPPRLDEEYVGA